MQTEERFALNLVLDKKRRLLMLRRSPEAKLSPNQWGLPAGKIELGESPREAAEREITEEIGNAHSTKCIRYFGPIKILITAAGTKSTYSSTSGNRGKSH